MPLSFQESELNALMQDFYTLTGIRVILFDENHNEIMSYPPFNETFCAYLRRSPEFDNKCRECDLKAFECCKKSNALYIHKCHAGLIDAAVPITEWGRIIGYMMLGQITGNQNRSDFIREIERICQDYGISDIPYKKLKSIKYRNEKQILAASHILDALTVYIKLREIVAPSGKQLIDDIERYTDAHINEDIDVARLCEEFKISRTRLYEQTRQYVNGGLAAFIKERRLVRAKELLCTNEMSAAEIADAVGFSDYNYFLRVFKKRFGISPKKMAISLQK